MRAYAFGMSIQKLFAIFIALAVVLAPALTGAGEAFAAVPDHHSQMMKSGHCEQMPTAPQSDEAAEADCCISMCMAVAASPAARVVEKRIRSAAPLSLLRQTHAGISREIATPPPRSA